MSSGISEAQDGVEEEISMEEFTPIGTAVLLVFYFLVLLAMWLFVYFGEFLGKSPVVVD